MMKTILASAAALSVMALGAAARFRQIQFLALYRHALTERNYLPYCSYEPRLVTIKVSNGYGGYYFQKVWKDVKVCY